MISFLEEERKEEGENERALGNLSLTQLRAEVRRARCMPAVPKAEEMARLEEEDGWLTCVLHTLGKVFPNRTALYAPCCAVIIAFAVAQHEIMYGHV